MKRTMGKFGKDYGDTVGRKQSRFPFIGKTPSLVRLIAR